MLAARIGREFAEIFAMQALSDIGRDEKIWFYSSIDFFGLASVDEKRSRGLGCFRNKPQRKSLDMDDTVSRVRIRHGVQVR